MVIIINTIIILRIRQWTPSTWQSRTFLHPKLLLISKGLYLGRKYNIILLPALKATLDLLSTSEPYWKHNKRKVNAKLLKGITGESYWKHRIRLLKARLSKGSRPPWIKGLDKGLNLWRKLILTPLLPLEAGLLRITRETNWKKNRILKNIAWISWLWYRIFQYQYLEN